MCLLLQISSRNRLNILININLKCYCEFFFFSIHLFYFTFYFIFVYFSHFRSSKNRGSMKVVHGPGPYFDRLGPWTRSTKGVHGPGVHVLYFPLVP